MAEKPILHAMREACAVRHRGEPLMPYWSKCDVEVDDLQNRIAFLQAVCRIAADRLCNGGVFPIKGETWSLLDYAAGPAKPAPSGDEESP